MNKREIELVNEAISHYVEHLREDPDPELQALADELEAIEVTDAVAIRRS